MSDLSRLEAVGVREWTQEDTVWEDALIEYRRLALSNIRASAERWGAATTALLGALGLSAILGGPDQFDTLQSNAESIAKVLFLAGVVAGICSVVASSWASTSTAASLFLPSGESARVATESAVESALSRLTFARWTAVVAVVLLVISGGVLILGNRDTSRSTLEIQPCRKAAVHSEATTACVEIVPAP
jgi:hypothetical protein